MKKLVCLILTLMMLSLMSPICVSAAPVDAEVTEEAEIEYFEGKDIICNSIEILDNGFVAVLTSVSESETVLDAEVTEEAEIEYFEGKDIICNSVEILDNGFVAVLTSVSESETVLGMERSYPEKEKTAVFSYTILDRNGEELGAFVVTVKGIYSEADREAYLTSITGTFYGTFASRFSYTSSINGQTGTVNIYFNGIKQGTLSYKINTNGNIENL